MDDQDVPRAGTSAKARLAQVAVISGTSHDKGVIVTQGADASGIYAGSKGVRSYFDYWKSLMIFSPSGQGGGGGLVGVTNHSDITTDGTNSHGIFAENQTGGYPQNVTNSLNSFDLSKVTISLDSVAGSSSYIDCTVSGSNGGTFILHLDGTFTFAPGISFDNLVAGEVVTTQISYRVKQSSTGGDDYVDGVLVVAVTPNGTADNVWHCAPGLVCAATNHFAAAGLEEGRNPRRA